jgi:hypothetical protein
MIYWQIFALFLAGEPGRRVKKFEKLEVFSPGRAGADAIKADDREAEATGA